MCPTWGQLAVNKIVITRSLILLKLRSEVNWLHSELKKSLLNGLMRSITKPSSSWFYTLQLSILKTYIIQKDIAKCRKKDPLIFPVSNRLSSYLGEEYLLKGCVLNENISRLESSLIYKLRRLVHLSFLLIIKKNSSSEFVSHYFSAPV